LRALAQGTFYHPTYCPVEGKWERIAMGKISTIVLIVAIMAPLPAIAYSQQDADACTPDAFRLCQNAIPDAARVAQCLVANKQQLSPACTSVFNRPRGATADREQPARAQPTHY
jgi:hypothetical protein